MCDLVVPAGRIGSPFSTVLLFFWVTVSIVTVASAPFGVDLWEAVATTVSSNTSALRFTLASINKIFKITTGDT